MLNDTARELFARGAQAFEAGNYSAAARAFEQIVDSRDVADADKAWRADMADRF